MARQINQAGLDLIKSFEGLRNKAYKDIVGVLTIGYGHTGSDFNKDTEWTDEECEEALKKDLARFEQGVEKLVKVPLSDNQFAALVSFAYNLGLGNLGSSTLLKLVNKQQYDAAAPEFLKWCRAGGKIVAGLQRRREAERTLFCS